MYKAVIFDLDGTLTDTLESIGVTCNEALKKVGYSPRPIEEYKYYAGDGADTLVQRALMAAGDNNCDKFKEAYEFYLDLFAKDCTYKVCVYNGILDMIKELKEKGIRLAVLTNKPHTRAIEVIDKFFPKDTFDIVYGQTKDTKKKPDPSGAIDIANCFGLDVKECVYVGDTNVDMKTGNGAGMYAVGVLWGFRGEEELRTNGAKKIINHPNELLELFK